MSQRAYYRAQRINDGDDDLDLATPGQDPGICMPTNGVGEYVINPGPQAREGRTILGTTLNHVRRREATRWDVRRRIPGS